MEIEFNKLRLKLNEKDQTASVIKSPKAIGDVFIPRFVEHKGKKYKIISIEHDAFKYNEISSLKYPENSEILTFKRQSFVFANISKLIIPSNLKYLEDGWCQCINNLVEIEISPKNKNFSFINNKFLVGKSDPDSDNFDILHLSLFDIIDAKIPPQIKEIASFSFYDHEKLETIEFPKNSKLKKIHKNAFYGSSLKTMILPSSVEEIEPLIRVRELKDIQISPKNRYLSYDNDSFLVQKVGNKSKIIFSRYDLTEIIIPSYINEIAPEVFSNSNLTSISFEENSCLEKICKLSFSIIPGSSSLTIPKSVKMIEVNAFTSNENLKSIEIMSESITIKSYCFARCENLSKISFPNAMDIEFEYNAMKNIPKSAKIFIRKNAKFHGEGTKSCKNQIVYIEDDDSNDNNDSNDFNDNESILISHIRFLENRLKKYEEVIPFDIETFKMNENNNSYFVKEKSESNTNNDYQKDKTIQELKELKEKCETLSKKVKQSKETISEKDNEIERLKKYLTALKEKTEEIKFVNLEEYSDQAIIGEGSTSSVKLVIKKENIQYAKKELKELNLKEFKRFISEGEILFRLRHPCIIRIIGINYGNKTEAPSIFLSLEPKSLEKSIINNELDDERKNMIIIELVLGMRYIHRQKFMHRDLKPSNILLSKNKHVRISDFGLAKEEDLETSRTKGVGTLRFMAPELFEENDNDNENDNEEEEEKNYTNKVDVYSFGIILIFIISGKYPKFIMKNVLNGIPPHLPDTIVSWVKELILKCLSKSPENRPSFRKIFEIMKNHNFDIFHEHTDKKMSKKERRMKEEIEQRIMKIEAFEYQHQEC